MHGIIMRGPEALQSQFSTSYGMVLNLLHSRSLAEAREFIQRSFSNYLGAPAQNCCVMCAFNFSMQRHMWMGPLTGKLPCGLMRNDMVHVLSFFAGCICAYMCVYL